MDGRIIIADDELVTRPGICDIAMEAGHEVIGGAADGFEAIEVYKKTQLDLVLMDIQMSTSGGLKAGKKIVQDQLTSSITFSSVYGDVQNTNKAKKPGALGYLVKLLDEKSLIPTAKMSIERGK